MHFFGVKFDEKGEFAMNKIFLCVALLLGVFMFNGCGYDNEFEEKWALYDRYDRNYPFWRYDDVTRKKVHAESEKIGKKWQGRKQKFHNWKY